MRILFFFIVLLFSTSATCQITEVTYQNSTNEVLSMEDRTGESVSWTVAENEISWQYYDIDSNLLLNENYNIVSTTKIDTERSVYYIVRSEEDKLLKFQFWVLDDGTKSVTVGYSDTYVNYLGKISFNINL